MNEYTNLNSAVSPSSIVIPLVTNLVYIQQSVFVVGYELSSDAYIATSLISTDAPLPFVNGLLSENSEEPVVADLTP